VTVVTSECVVPFACENSLGNSKCLGHDDYHVVAELHHVVTGMIHYTTGLKLELMRATKASWTSGRHHPLQFFISISAFSIGIAAR
jgi:hypothetical protein